jgi:hypothetical protein
MTETGMILDNPTLDTATLAKLSTYEDYLAYYMQLNDANNVISWSKADFLLYMSQKLGSNSIMLLSKEIGLPFGTVDNYIRVAKAFPFDRRNYELSFSHHFKASFADTYDKKTKTFLTDKRFEWLNKAQDDKMSTRRLQANIQEEKEKIEDPNKGILCTHCGKPDKRLQKWTLTNYGDGHRVITLYLHEICAVDILNFIDERPTKTAPTLA